MTTPMTTPITSPGLGRVAIAQDYVSVGDFLKRRAVNIIVGGNYVFPNRYDPQGKLRTFACRTTRVSPFRMLIEVPVMGKIGDRLTSYFPDFGTFASSIGDTKAGALLL